MIKRELTDQQIENVLSFIKLRKNIPQDVAQNIADKQKESLRKQLIGCKIYPELIPKLAENLERIYHNSLIQAGETVGVLCAQSVGEQHTQQNLNKFHKAGSSESSQSTATNFNLLMNATKPEKTITNGVVFFKKGNENLAQLRQTIGKDLIGFNIQKLILKSKTHETVSYEKILDSFDEPEWYRWFQILYGEIDMDEYTHRIRLKIDMSLIYTYRLSLKSICDRINEVDDSMISLFSPDSVGIIDVLVNCDNLEIPENSSSINQNNAELTYIERVVFELISKLHITGIEKIKNMYFIKDNEKGGWAIETDGSDLQSVLALPFVDKSRCLVSNIWDIYHVLGIEATREFMIRKFLESVGSSINKCHLEILVDKMTFRGIMPISRDTVKNSGMDPISQASFEETMNIFIKAGVMGKKDSTDSISSSIVCGKRVKIGTGICDVKMKIPPKIIEEEEESSEEESSEEESSEEESSESESEEESSEEESSEEESSESESEEESSEERALSEENESDYDEDDYESESE